MATLCPEEFSEIAQSARVVVTGSTGLIGQAFCKDFPQAVRAGRRGAQLALSLPDVVPMLDGYTHVLHLAGIAHQSASEGDYHAVNVEGTVALFKAAQRSGVQTFVYVSSIKAMGAESKEVYSSKNFCEPVCAYGESKLTAELRLTELARQSAMKLVIVRPTLVWGGQLKGNLELMSKLIAMGLPLPLKWVRNQRSLCHINNLITFIYHALFDPRLKGGVYLVADPKPLSTVDVAHGLALMQNKRARLFGFPPFLLRLAFLLIGRAKLYSRLCGSLSVDISATEQACSWRSRMYKFNEA